MAYIPKNRIKTNLVSNGEFIIASTGKTYYGYYHALYNGKFYTGKTQYDFPILELIKPNNTTSNIVLNNNTNEVLSIPVDSKQYSYVIYNALDPLNEPLPKILPSLYIPIVTENDINIGELTRYFMKKTNENLYIEVNQEQYNNFQSQNSDYFWEIYTPVSIPWNITGDVEKTYMINKNIVELWEQKNEKVGLGAYLKYDYLEFYQYEPKENQYTSGNEFLNELGKEYIGYYHIDKLLGPRQDSMNEGKFHKKLYYKKLYQSNTETKTTFGLKNQNDVIVGLSF